MRISVVGTGYVGLVTGTCLAEIGNRVVCLDIDHEKIAQLAAGKVPIYEPGLDEMIRHNHNGGRLSFTTDLAQALRDCEVCFLAVGTPPAEDGSADKRHVLDAVRSIAGVAGAPFTLVVKSTVPVGTCLEVSAVLAEGLDARGMTFEVPVVSNPEFLKEGHAVEDFMRPDRIIVGSATEAGFEVMRNVYRHFIRNGHTFLPMDLCSSEMTKYAANAMLATRISLMNELALLCEQIGADVMSVRRGVGSDRRIGMDFLYPGVGFGGSCFPKDVKALTRLALDAGCAADILASVEGVNNRQKALLADRVIERFGGSLSGRQIALWGLAFKPKTDDIREAPALTVLGKLIDAGATVCAYDPAAMDNARRELAGVPGLHFADGPYEALDGADALVLVTEWAVFRSLDMEQVHGRLKLPIVFDGRNQYDPTHMTTHGIEYHCIGRPTG